MAVATIVKVAVLGMVVLHRSAIGTTRTRMLDAPLRVRDVAFGGPGVITGTVEEKGTPANTPLRRRVRLHREADGLPVRETWSDAATGAYEFAGIDPAYRYTAIAYDYEHNHRAVAADNLTPEVLP